MKHNAVDKEEMIRPLILQEVIVSFLLGSTVAFQQEDGGPWTQGRVLGRGDHNHSNRSYMTQITDMVCSYQIQETHKSNTYNSQTLPQGSVKQKHHRLCG